MPGARTAVRLRAWIVQRAISTFVAHLAHALACMPLVYTGAYNSARSKFGPSTIVRADLLVARHSAPPWAAHTGSRNTLSVATALVARAPATAGLHTVDTAHSFLAHAAGWCPGGVDVCCSRVGNAAATVLAAAHAFAWDNRAQLFITECTAKPERTFAHLLRLGSVPFAFSTLFVARRRASAELTKWWCPSIAARAHAILSVAHTVAEAVPRPRNGGLSAVFTWVQFRNRQGGPGLNGLHHRPIVGKLQRHIQFQAFVTAFHFY